MLHFYKENPRRINTTFIFNIDNREPGKKPCANSGALDLSVDRWIPVSFAELFESREQTCLTFEVVGSC